MELERQQRREHWHRDDDDAHRHVERALVPLVRRDVERSLSRLQEPLSLQELTNSRDAAPGERLLARTAVARAETQRAQRPQLVCAEARAVFAAVAMER